MNELTNPFCRSRRALLLAIVTALVVILTAPVAWAESPFRVAAQLEDKAGTLGRDQQAEAQAAIDELQSGQRVQLWMVYVETFSGMSGRAWAAETFDRSDLGLRDLLLAVAIDDRAYAYSADADFPLSDGQLNDVMANDVEPYLQDNNWSAAVVGAAQGLQEALAGPQSEPAAAGGDASQSAGSGFPLWIVAIAVVVIAAVVLLVVRGAVRSRRGGPAAPGQLAAEAVSLEDLRKQANLQLVETDDAMKTSEDELGFATAEFGEEATRPFQSALETARAAVVAAFKLRRQLDETRDEAEQRRLLTEILRHTQTANDSLDAEAERFDKLRDLEANVPQLIAGVEQRLTDLEVRLPQASRALADLATEYAPSALTAVARNVDDARSRIGFARDELNEGHAELTAGHRGEAVVSTVAAEEAAAQATQFLDAITRLGDDLQAAAGSIAEAVAETRRDIAEAQAPGEHQATLAPLVATAAAAVAAAETAAAPEDGRDPLTALLRLRKADDALETALQHARDQQAQRARAAASLERSLLAARSELASANNFITTHRGAIGAGPRTLLADGQQQLQQSLALAASDPVTAAKYAARSQELAVHALMTAQSELSTATAPQLPQVPGGGAGRGGGTGGAGNLAGAIIGGILLNAVLGGGFGGRRGGGFNPGSFGGGGTRMRRSGGGRF